MRGFLHIGFGAAAAKGAPAPARPTPIAKDAQTGILYPSLTMRPGQYTATSFWSAQRRNSNCYAYALDEELLGWAQPGQLTQDPPGDAPEMAVPVLSTALARDGLVQVHKHAVAPQTHHVIGLVVEPGSDFHFYRLDADGTWSHKPGPFSPRREDARGQAIHDLEAAHLGRYCLFGGYFALPQAGIPFVPRF